MMRGISRLHLVIFTFIGLLLFSCDVEEGSITAHPQTTPDSSLTDRTQLPNPQGSASEDQPDDNLENNITPQAGSTIIATTLPEPTESFGTPSPFRWDLFDPGDLWEDVEPVTYIDDACVYLEMRWDPERSPPGTIVAPIMFHSVKKSGRPIEDATSISEEYFHAVMAQAQDLGYETITTEELIAFLTTNAKIPERSMYMVLDDRRPGVTERFIPSYCLAC